MPDMLVKLYELPPRMEREGSDYRIHRAMTPDKSKIVEWARTHMGESMAGECDACFGHHPVSCFVASRGNEVLGFACYHATAPEFFGPTMVLESERGKNLGRALLLECLHAMREEGYGYAVIGGAGPVKFYEKCVGAIVIPDSEPGIYKNYLATGKE